MTELDGLIELLVSDSQLATGAPVEWLHARDAVARPVIVEKSAGRNANWSAEEEAFYIEHLADMTLEEIAAALGRSASGVKCHRFKAGLPSHRRTPGYLTTHQVALILGVDGHSPPLWVDHGIMPGEKAPFSAVNNRRVRWISFKRWLIRPTSWVYFKLERMQPGSLRRLVELAQARWGDEWWSTKQAAAAIGCSPDDIDRYIQLGRVPSAFQAPLLGGRNPNQRWAWWFLRKSEALQLVVVRKGDADANRELGGWTERADRFLLRARAEGREWQEIARMMKWPIKRVQYRGKTLIERKMISVEERLPDEEVEVVVKDAAGKLWLAVRVGQVWLVAVEGKKRLPGGIKEWRAV